MIENLLREDAAAWQRDLDAGARPAVARRTFDWRPLAAVAAVLIVVAGALVLRARSDGTDEAAHPLAGTRWVDPVSGGEVVFARTTVRVFDTCSNVTHRLTVSARTFTIGAQVGVASTCGGTPEQHLRSDHFNRVVTGTVGWTRSGSTLTLTRDGQSLVLRSAAVRTLAGTHWRLKVIPSSGPGFQAIGPAQLFIDPDGTVRAGDLCSTVTGHATISGDVVTFTTKFRCFDPGFSPPTREIETVLSGRATYFIQGDRLTLVDGSHALVYVAAG